MLRGARLAAALAAGGLLACALVSPGTASAARSSRPSIVSLTASPRPISNTGGVVLVQVRVRGAAQCSFEGQQFGSAPFALVRTVACSGGQATALMPVQPNLLRSAAIIHFRVTAGDRTGHSSVRTIAVAQAAAQAPAPAPTPAQPLAITSGAALPAGVVGAAYTTTLAASGGSGRYSWTVTSGALPSGLTLAGAGTLSGTPTSGGRSSFSVQVTDGAGHTATGSFTLTVAAAPTPSSTVPSSLSTNWSGYVLTGGPYTGATGTFTVPSLSSASQDGTTSEWVGIDGTSSSNPSIIQAGITEKYTAATNDVLVYAWIELYPQPAVFAPLVVNASDKVTVTIAQSSAGTWSVQLTDATSGQTYSESDPWSGPATSAEWIVEAPTDATSGQVENLATFSPVTFSGLAIDPAAGDFSRVVMEQGGVTVSTPSDLDANGFTVAYGAVRPNAP